MPNELTPAEIRANLTKDELETYAYFYGQTESGRENWDEILRAYESLARARMALAKIIESGVYLHTCCETTKCYGCEDKKHIAQSALGVAAKESEEGK